MLKTEVPVAKLRVVIPPLGAFLGLPPMYVMDDAPENLVNVRASLAENRDYQIALQKDDRKIRHPIWKAGRFCSVPLARQKI